jgi:transketolase
MGDAVNSIALARSIRVDVLGMTHRVNASHVGTCLSIADILAVLYAGVARVDPARPDWADRDRVILSKGHGAAALYAVLARTGFFDAGQLESFCADGSLLMGHASHHVPGVDFSTGSLGHGLSLACGTALAALRQHSRRRSFVILSDGECDEGAIWEAALFAPHHKLQNLTAIIDANGLQSCGRVGEVLGLEPLAAKWSAFGWRVVEIDGHDHRQIRTALAGTPENCEQPTVVIARTVKGKGVSFMENALEWHYRAPDAAQLQRALAELGPQA